MNQRRTRGELRRLVGEPYIVWTASDDGRGWREVDVTEKYLQRRVKNAVMNY